MALMGWSTRQLAELAGTTVRAVRHYHEIGLLPEPERRANGYKRYGVAHLIRLMRIKRLIGLGLSLTQIADLGEADAHPEEALRAMDAELAATIDRLQRIRAELALLLRQPAPIDLPPPLATAVAKAEVSAADHSFLVVLTRVLGPAAPAAYAELYGKHPKPPEFTEFDDLPAEADEATRQDLAERMAPLIRQIGADVPSIQVLAAGSPHGVKHAQRTIVQAMLDLYNPAQIDVLVRATS